MKTVQLDKNAGGKKLRDACNAEGLVQCFLLPKLHRDMNDEDVLKLAINKGNLTLTFDRPLFFTSGHVIAGQNPGGVILRMDDGSLQQMSTKTAPGVLRKFKEDFPDWCSAPWRNSLVEITPTIVFIYHTMQAVPCLLECLDRASSDWQARLRKHLDDNACR
jgi:hypothetical protein